MGRKGREEMAGKEEREGSEGRRVGRERRKGIGACRSSPIRTLNSPNAEGSRIKAAAVLSQHTMSWSNGSLYR